MNATINGQRYAMNACWFAKCLKIAAPNNCSVMAFVAVKLTVDKKEAPVRFCGLFFVIGWVAIELSKATM